MKEKEIIEITKSFENSKVLIIGDVMIDQYLTGSVSRISPEAPIQILDHKESTQRLGGAANVALNIKALRAEPLLLSIVGKDQSGDDFLELMRSRKINTNYILKHPTKRTTRKTRIMSGHQHLLRVDFEDKSYIDDDFSNKIIALYKSIIENQSPEVVIIQDYNKGLLTKKVIEAVIKIANKHNIPTAVDPKFDNFYAYKNVTLFKPNLKELSEAINTSIKPTTKNLIEADKKLREILNHQISFFTLSENGIFAANNKTNIIKPTTPRLISDVCGAGDAVISIVALSISKNLNLNNIIDFANTAGGQVCEISGVSPLNIDHIVAELTKNAY